MIMVEQLLNRCRSFLKTEHLLNKKDRVLLAVSGGLDSVVLCHVLNSIGEFDIGLAHCNFKLRGADADGDADFVRDLGAKLDIPVFSIAFDTEAEASANKESIQMAARRLRYDWMEEIRKENNYTFIATAHHQNDVMETQLINLTKGTGVAGLHGILPKNGKVIRPILNWSRKEVAAYAEAVGLQWREDSSNASTKYTRNKIRHEVVPVLETLNPNAVQTFYDTAQRFREIEAVYRFGIEQYRKKLFESKRHRKDILISIGKLKQIDGVGSVLYELLKDYGFKAGVIPQIIDAFDAEAGKIFLSDTHQLLKDRKHFILSTRSTEESEHVSITAEVKSMLLSVGNLDISYLEKSDLAEGWQNASSNIAYLDAEKVEWPLLCKEWEAGSGAYFYPLGMGMKKKKLKRFFSDIKLSKLDKARMRLLYDQKGRIIWLIGERIDERFKITDKTTTVLRLEITERSG